MQATKAAPTRLKLSKKLIERLPVPEGTRQYLYDETQPKLAICITPSGVRVFYCVRKFEGKTVRVRLGGFPDISLERARDLCDKALAKFAAGQNPQVEKRTSRDEDTFGAAFERYLDEHAKKHKRSWREDEGLFNRYCESLKSHRLSGIDQATIRGLHTRVGADHGKYAANRMLSLVSTLFSFATPNGPNPCKGVKRFKEEQRDRFLQADELKRFFDALDRESSLMKDYFMLALLTGARRGNVQSMRWDQLHLDRNEWRIPLTKAGESQIVYLPAEAVAILRARQVTAKSEYVFPSRNGSKRPYLTYQYKSWDRICAQAKLDSIRPHDLRRSLGSWQAAGGASLPVIGKSLGHRNQSTTAIYARLNLDPVRASVDVAVAAMLKAAKAKPAKKRKG